MSRACQEGVLSKWNKLQQYLSARGKVKAFYDKAIFCVNWDETGNLAASINLGPVAVLRKTD
jgi:hypothetical protein